jgi:hypothetical protein
MSKSNDYENPPFGVTTHIDDLSNVKKDAIAAFAAIDPGEIPINTVDYNKFKDYLTDEIKKLPTNNDRLHFIQELAHRASESSSPIDPIPKRLAHLSLTAYLDGMASAYTDPSD